MLVYYFTRDVPEKNFSALDLSGYPGPFPHLDDNDLYASVEMDDSEVDKVSAEWNRPELNGEEVRTRDLVGLRMWRVDEKEKKLVRKTDQEINDIGVAVLARARKAAGETYKQRLEEAGYEITKKG